jgi:hypothetical protein
MALSFPSWKSILAVTYFRAALHTPRTLTGGPCHHGRWNNIDGVYQNGQCVSYTLLNFLLSRATPRNRARLYLPHPCLRRDLFTIPGLGGRRVFFLWHCCSSSELWRIPWSAIWPAIMSSHLRISISRVEPATSQARVHNHVAMRKTIAWKIAYVTTQEEE